MMYRSFVDLVFIMLCALTLVLTQSISLKGLKANPADADAAQSGSITAHRIQVVVIAEEWMGVDGEKFNDVQSLLGRIDPAAQLVVVPENAEVSHHRVMEAWTILRRSGREVELGVRPSKEEGAT
jgi:biopolymer transport protein ExbD